MPLSLEPSAAWRLGAALAPLAGDGVLVVGSGSLTHNLYEFRQGPGHDAAYAVEFVEWVRDAALSRDRERLLSALTDAPHALQAHATAEHFLPLLFAAGAPADNATVEVLYGGMTHGVLPRRRKGSPGRTSPSALPSGRFDGDDGRIAQVVHELAQDEKGRRGLAARGQTLQCARVAERG